MKTSIIISIICPLFIPNTHALIAYDCGGKEINVTTVSLLDVEDCDIPTMDLEPEKKNIQLLQIID